MESRALRRTLHVALFLPVSVLVGVLAATACSSSDGGDGTSPSGSATSTGSGTTTSPTGSSTGGGGDAGGGGGGDDAATGADSSSPGGPGFAALGVNDGIVATIDGTQILFTNQALHVPQGNVPAPLLIGAKTANFQGGIQIRMKTDLGQQDCTGDIDNDDISIGYGDTGTGVNGTTVTPGTCTIQLTATAPKIEGTFVASLKGGNGMLTVTDGAFRITP